MRVERSGIVYSYHSVVRVNSTNIKRHKTLQPYHFRKIKISQLNFPIDAHSYCVEKMEKTTPVYAATVFINTEIWTAVLGGNYIYRERITQHSRSLCSGSEEIYSKEVFIAAC